jgi:hypothetical protein
MTKEDVMTKITVFIQVQGKADITEAELPEQPTLADLDAVLDKVSIKLDKDLAIFIDEGEEQDQGDRNGPLKNFKRGCRIHLSRCRKIKTSVHYLERTIERAFTPGTRVRAVKAWVVRELKIDEKDAGEHILRLCNSTREPPTDTPLVELADPQQCSVCFDFVPIKRVEG